MQKRITIQSAHVNNNKLTLTVSEDISGFIPGSHILSDSDQFSFIYLMEKEEEYTYIIIPEVFWPILKESLRADAKAVLQHNHDEIELTLFKEELEYLISNIKGNGNYGEKMIEKVESLFGDF
ncbi:MAG: hypothetical protein Q8934_11140 [Bacillota bacterium]|nr:hypothetical protein [Bacillota bacterium]